MMKFALSDKDFESCRAQVAKSEQYLEILKLTNDEYMIFDHRGDSVTERGDFTKEELKTIWRMLTTNK